MDEQVEKRIKELIQEQISIVSYDPHWPQLFTKEKRYLEQILPKGMIKRIEHFGSTAISGLPAKPIIDILVEVTSLEETKKRIVPLLISKGYEYFWRPTIGNEPPYYAWFIKRDTHGKRTHHIHMVEADSVLWDALFFRDFLKEFPEEKQRYTNLKKTLAGEYEHDRVSYTKGKTEYINKTTKKAKQYYQKKICSRPDKKQK